LYAQEPAAPPPQQTTTRQQADNLTTEPAKTWVAMLGKVQSIKPGREITIIVDDGGNKTYNLADTKRSTTVAEDLAVGDRVLLLESKEEIGPVRIVRDTGGGAAQDDQQRARRPDKSR
jgi:hypothetical protein